MNPTKINKKQKNTIYYKKNSKNKRKLCENK